LASFESSGLESPCDRQTSGWAKQAGEKLFHFHRLNIGSRLTLCFVFIILAMLVGNAVLLWQFHRARAQAERLSAFDQELIAVLQAHTNLMSLYERLDALAHSEDTARLVSESEALRNALLENNRRSRNALTRLPPEVQLDPALLPTPHAIQGTLPSQLEAITALAKSKDWAAVRLRLANEVRPLESKVSALVENIDRDVGEERAQAVVNIERAQRRILLIVPITAALTLLFAAFLGLAITRSITHPLGRLMDASKALGRSEFEHRVSVVGKDEVAHLGRAFNDTAGTLRDLYEALHSREAYLAEAQRLSHTGSFGWNLSSGELVWTDETFRIFECGPTVKPTVEFVLQRTHPEDVALVQQLIDRVSRDRTDWELEHRLLMPDGRVKHVQVVARSSMGGKRSVLFVGAVTDITERKRAEEALRESEERFRTMADRLPEAIWIRALSPEKVLYVSPSFERIWGMPLEDLYRNPHLWAEAIHPDDRNRIVGMFTRWTTGEDASSTTSSIGSPGPMAWFAGSMSAAYSLLMNMGVLVVSVASRRISPTANTNRTISRTL
jgi:PAS domain S-box-containing protein